MPRQRRTFTDDFKRQMVQLFENGKRYFKASSADHGTKVSVIKRNRGKYSVSAMCNVYTSHFLSYSRYFILEILLHLSYFSL